MNKSEVINWLLEGDVSIQFQTHRDLLDIHKPELQQRIQTEGWGRKFLMQRNSNGHWGNSFYQPKWISTHYTLLDLKNLNIPPDVQEIKETLILIFTGEKGSDGGINPGKTINQSDVCVNGMALNYASYFGVEEKQLNSVIDFLLDEKMPDGGFNCRSNRSGAKHSSLHTTISVLEGILEYKRNNYQYRLDELLEAETSSREFILQHKLYKSDKSGKVIDQRFTRLSYPSRWRYDILRALDYFRDAKVKYDSRMQDALNLINSKRRKDQTWALQANHPGAVHFNMEKPGIASRWNTLRTLRILHQYENVS